MGSSFNTLRTTMIWLGRLLSQWLPVTPGDDTLEEDPETVRQDLHRVWNPPGVWKKFIAGQGS